MPAYKSYCWSLGTTSFRMVEFNRKIEEQLKLLNEFWQIPANINQHWSANNTLQTQYYKFIIVAYFCFNSFYFAQEYGEYKLVRS